MKAKSAGQNYERQRTSDLRRILMRTEVQWTIRRFLWTTRGRIINYKASYPNG